MAWQYYFLAVISSLSLQWLVSKLAKNLVAAPETSELSAVTSFLHLERKAQHALTGICFFFVYTLLISSAYINCALLLCCCTAFYLTHRARLIYPEFQNYLVNQFRNILRPRELISIPSAFYFMLGVALLVLIFSKTVALLGILYLSLGDPMASLTGIIYTNRVHGGKSSGGKTFAGSFGAAVTCALVTMVFLWFSCNPPADSYIRSTGNALPDMELSKMIIISLYGGFVGALAEATQIGNLDDNLTLPLISGILLTPVVDEWIRF